MAYDKPYKNIEGRPNAVKNNSHKYCLHSLKDNKKVTKVSIPYLENIYEFSRHHELIIKFNRLKKTNYLIKRRKNRQKIIQFKKYLLKNDCEFRDWKFKGKMNVITDSVLYYFLDENKEAK